MSEKHKIKSLTSNSLFIYTFEKLPEISNLPKRFTSRFSNKDDFTTYVTTHAITPIASITALITQFFVNWYIINATIVIIAIIPITPLIAVLGIKSNNPPHRCKMRSTAKVLTAAIIWLSVNADKNIPIAM